VAACVKKTDRSKRVDSVRASKDGHQFHEAWVARRALGLLLLRFDLYGIVSKHGAETVGRKITYSINSNRPFASEVLEAFRAASTGQPAVSADADAQLSQLRSAVKQSDDGLRRFADRVLLVGRMDSLEAVERGNARTVADWSASNDALARARISSCFMTCCRIHRGRAHSSSIIVNQPLSRQRSRRSRYAERR
jgi:hypothetical protein